jgi:hypothetical protein
MKKLFLLLVTFTNISYASFPIQSNLVTSTDTLQTDMIKEYHTSLIKMGIDLNTCKCESCRNGIVPLVINSELNKAKKDIKRKNRKGAIIIMTISSVGLIILLFSWMDSFNKSGGIGVG